VNAAATVSNTAPTITACLTIAHSVSRVGLSRQLFGLMYT
jgi:hypothetical protein